MSFSWTTVTQNVTPMAPLHLNEIKTATDTLSGKLGIGNYSWSGRFPLSQTSKVSYADLNELRSGLDYVHNNNVCAAHNADKDTTINSTQCPTNNSNVETANNASNHQNYLASPNYTSNNASPQYTSNNGSPQYTSNNATNHQNYLASPYNNAVNGSPQYSVNYATNYTSYNGTANTSVK